MQQNEESSCYLSLLKETLVQIDRTLRDLRKSNGIQKTKQHYQLRQLRQLHLLFAHHPHNYQLIMSYFGKIQVKFNLSDLHKINAVKNMKDEL